MTTALVACPSCHAKLKLSKAFATGTKLKCPKCGANFPLQGGEDSVPSERMEPSLTTRETASDHAGPRAVEHPTIDQASDNNGDEGPVHLDFLRPAEAPGELGRLGHFRILKELGRGGMGMVFLAEDLHLLRSVALKIMLPQHAARAEFRERFLREARTAASIQNDHIITIHEVAEDNGVPYLTMPVLRGEALSDRLRRDKRPPLPEVLRIAWQICDGLEAAHDRHLVHRDLKPANIWLESTRDPNASDGSDSIKNARPAKPSRVKILDFGLARSVNADVQLTRTGVVLGTPSYMAPEQARNPNVDAPADLFSLGIILYQMTTGKLPFHGHDAMSVMLAICNDDPPPPLASAPDMPQELSDLIMKLLAKKPGERYASAHQLAAALEAIDAEHFKGQAISGSSRATATMPAAQPSAPDEKTSPATSILSASEKSPHARKAPVLDQHPTEPAGAAAAPTVAPAGPGRAGKRLWFFLAVAGIALVAAVALVLLTFRTSGGTLIIEIDDQEVEARFKNGALQLFDNDGKLQYTLKPSERNKDLAAGPYKISVVGADGLAVDTPEFMLKKGDKVTVRVTLDAKEAGKKDSTATFKNSIGMEFVKVPKGTGWLGGEAGKQGEQKVEVLEDFYLGKYEVTQEEWEKVTGLNPSEFKRGNDKVKDIPDADLKRFPVEIVSWEDCQVFIERLNKKEKGSGWVYRLPTEAEWEYACRAGPGDKFDSVFDFYFAKPTNTLVPDQANFAPVEGKGLQRTCKVGSYAPNVLGLYDMHGNVWEWCDDMLPPDPKGASRRVFRGGSWSLDSGLCRAANRGTLPPSRRSNHLGLRLARVPVGKDIVKGAPGEKATPVEGKKDSTATFKNSIGMEFVKVPKGTGWLGGEGGKQGEQKVEVLEDFYLGKYEVTQEEWERVTGLTPSEFKRGNDKVKDIPDADLKRFPVEVVSWDDCQLFIDRLNKKEKENGWVYRLPTEAEWEYACRGGPVDRLDSAFDFYFAKPTNTLLPDQANFLPAKGKGLQRTCKVGSYAPNALGLYDMHGNVWEWCNVTEKAEDRASLRVIRGGSWFLGSGFCRAADRIYAPAFLPEFYLGLRLARVPVGKDIVKGAPGEKKTPAEGKKDLPATFKNSIGMEFVKVPKGTGWLGGEAGKQGEQKVEVLEDFYLGKYEVTQEEWETVTKLTPSTFKRGHAAVKDIPDADLKRFPVETVSWDDCQLFIDRLNKKEKDTGWVYRLPTEAEWEYACRGGPVDRLDSAFDFYFAKPTNTLVPDQANFAPVEGKGLQRTCKVGSYAPNVLGLYDMHGNVWEWCDDMLPPDPKGASLRVGRGGSWCNVSGGCRAAVRNAHPPSFRYDFLGLRLARVPVGKDK